MRTAGAIDPGPIIQTCGRHDEGGSIHPFADRIAIPPGLGILGKLPAVGPDDPPDFAECVEEEYFLGRLQDLGCPYFVKVFPGHSLRVTSYDRIVRLCREHGSYSIARLVLVKDFPALGSVGQLMLWIAVLGDGL